MASKTPEQTAACAAARRERAMGRPRQVDVNEEVYPHVMALRNAGCPFDWIAAEAAVSHGAVIKMCSGKQKRINRQAAERLLRVRASDYDGVGFTKGGNYMPGLGASRRLCALQYDGFTFSFIADYWGKHLQEVSAIANLKHPQVLATTHVQVAQIYDKLAGVKPSDMGVNDWQAKHAVTYAARRPGMAPSIYWHDESLDDPDGFPDWTGACGERRGRALHEQEGIPMCPPCNAAQAAYEKDRKARHREAAERGEEVVKRRGNGKYNRFDDEALMSRLRHDFEAWTSVEVMEERYGNDVAYLRQRALRDGMWTHPHAKPDRNWAPKRSRGMVES